MESITSISFFQRKRGSGVSRQILSYGLKPSTSSTIRNLRPWTLTLPIRNSFPVARLILIAPLESSFLRVSLACSNSEHASPSRKESCITLRLAGIFRQAFLLGAPGRALLLGSESLLRTRQGES